MDKQHFDHIESRIRQAANEISITENDEAWKKMEVMLDAEFHKDRRRSAIWWWFLGGLIILIVSGLFIYQHYSSIFGDKISSASKVPQNIKSGIKADHEPNINKNGKTEEDRLSKYENRTEQTMTDRGNQQKTPEISINKQKYPLINNQPSVNEPTLITSRIVRKRRNVNVAASSQKDKKIKSKNSLTKDEEIINPAVTKKDSRDRIESVPEKKGGSPGNNTADVLNNTPVIIDSSKSPVSAIARSEKKNGVENNSLLRKNSSPVRLTDNRKKGFYIIGSVAGDVTAIKNIFKQDVKPVYGLSVGYQFNKRLHVQGGFYAGKKIYAAGPGDYKLKPGSYIAKIIRADAECYIYDIPVSVRYNVLPRKASNGYLMAGISSVILKREIYDMHFFNPSGTYRRMSYTYTDNTAFLSIFNLAIGYEHKLSNALYILAEPYLKLPLSGLGEGKVKLYSAGLQLGIKYQPFNVKRKKI